MKPLKYKGYVIRLIDKRSLIATPYKTLCFYYGEVENGNLKYALTDLKMLMKEKLKK